MEDDALGRAGVVEHAQHVVVGVAVVDDQRLAVPLGHLDVRPEGRLLHVAARPARCGSGRARSPPRRVRRCRPPGRRSRPGPRRARRPRRAAAPRWGAARRPRRPRRAACAVSTAQRAPGRSQPICTMRGTPTAAARGQRVLDRQPVVGRVGDVEVAVAVGDRHRQRLGGRRPLARSAHRPPRARVGPLTSCRSGPRCAGRAARTWSRSLRRAAAPSVPASWTRCVGDRPERGLGAQRVPQRAARLGHHRVEQHRDDAQRLGRGVEDPVEVGGRATRPWRPARRLLGDVVVDDRGRSPSRRGSRPAGRSGRWPPRPSATAVAAASASAGSSAVAGQPAVAVAADHRGEPGREVAELVGELGLVARAAMSSHENEPSWPNGIARRK